MCRQRDAVCVSRWYGPLVGPHLVVGLTFAASIALLGCGDLKNASGSSASGGGIGPGANGSLPSGYCCTADAECRDRHCVAVGAGGRMCLDTCREQGTCARRGLTFTCSGSLAAPGLCQPPAPAFACIAQTQFQRGGRQVGDCCTHTGDGNAGEECDGNRCVGVDEQGQNNPYVCSHWCELTKDCATGTICELNDCVPANRPYVCR